MCRACVLCIGQSQTVPVVSLLEGYRCMLYRQWTVSDSACCISIGRLSMHALQVMNSLRQCLLYLYWKAIGACSTGNEQSQIMAVTSLREGYHCISACSLSRNLGQRLLYLYVKAIGACSVSNSFTWAAVVLNVYLSSSFAQLSKTMPSCSCLLK